MADTKTPEQRSRNMSLIRSKNTKPEETVRKKLFARGYRYRKNVRGLPGCPDIVLSKYKAVIFIQGCFWHMHDCGRFRWPSTNIEYWKPKILKNIERDNYNQKCLRDQGWNVIIVWECELKKKLLEATINRIDSEIKTHMP